MKHMEDEKMSTVLRQVAALSNPALPRATMVRRKKLFNGLCLVSSEEAQDYGAALFTYNVDPTRFDTGFVIDVGYHRNLEQNECVENNMIENPGEYTLPAALLYDHFISRVELTEHLIRLVFKTVDGQPTFVHIDASAEVPYPSLPTDVDLPVLPIASLRRTATQFCHLHIDIVLFDGEMFAFKHYGLNPLVRLRTPEFEHRPPNFKHGEDSVLEPREDSLLKELKHLLRFDSPFIVKAKAMVSGPSGAFRGFLTPFYPAGNLQDIFWDLHPQSPSSSGDWEPLVLQSQSDGTSAQVRVSADNLPERKMISWDVKEIWATDIVRGVVALHAASSFCGDLKLPNIVLGEDGHVRLIDVAPQSGWSEEYMAPEGALIFKLPNRRIELSAERDIFAVGLILWALSEEVAQFERAEFGAAPVLVWRDGVDATPSWYRELVEQCVQSDPEKRPSALAVLETLVASSGPADGSHI